MHATLDYYRHVYFTSDLILKELSFYAKRAQIFLNPVHQFVIRHTVLAYEVPFLTSNTKDRAYFTHARLDYYQHVCFPCYQNYYCVIHILRQRILNSVMSYKHGTKPTYIIITHVYKVG